MDGRAHRWGARGGERRWLYGARGAAVPRVREAGRLRLPPASRPGVVSPGSAAILRSRPEAAQGAERLRVYLRGQVGAAAARRSSGRAGQERRGVRGERDPPRAE